MNKRGIATCMAIAIAFSQAAMSAVISTSSTVGTFTGSGGFTLEPVNGLNQFDASLGTLTGINFNVDISSYDATLFLESFDDPGTGALFDFANLSAQISINYSTPGGGGLLFATEGLFGTIFGEFDSFDIGPVSSSRSEDATTRLQTAGVFNDFIGTGTLGSVDLGVFAFFQGAQVFLDDGSQVDGTPGFNSFSVGPATVSVDYTYTPTVPVPAAVWLFGSGLVALFGFSKRKR